MFHPQDYTESFHIPQVWSKMIDPEVGSKLQPSQSESFLGTLDVKLRKSSQSGSGAWTSRLKGLLVDMWLTEEKKLALNKSKNEAGLQRNVGISVGGLACKVKQSFSQYYVVHHEGAAFTLIHLEWHPLEHDRVAWGPRELCLFWIRWSYFQLGMGL